MKLCALCRFRGPSQTSENFLNFQPFSDQTTNTDFKSIDIRFSKVSLSFRLSKVGKRDNKIVDFVDIVALKAALNSTTTAHL